MGRLFEIVWLWTEQAKKRVISAVLSEIQNKRSAEEAGFNKECNLKSLCMF